MATKLANAIRLWGLTFFSGNNSYTHTVYTFLHSLDSRYQFLLIFLSLVLLLLYRSGDTGILTLALRFQTGSSHFRLA